MKIKTLICLTTFFGARAQAQVLAPAQDEDPQFSRAPTQPGLLYQRVEKKFLQRMVAEKIKAYQEFQAYNSQPRGRSGSPPSLGPSNAIELDRVDYGCFCRNLVRYGSSVPINRVTQLGHPIDEVDKLCKLLINGWACLQASGVDLSMTYQSPGGVFNVDDAVDKCRAINQSEEAQNLCMVEEHFTTGLITLLFNGYSLMDNPIKNEVDRMDICHPGWENNGYNDGDRALCCDTFEYPFKCVISASHSSQCDAEIGWGL